MGRDFIYLVASPFEDTFETDKLGKPKNVHTLNISQ